MRMRSWRAGGRAGALLALVAVLALAWTGCNELLNSPTIQDTETTDTAQSELAARYGMASPLIREVIAVQEQHTPTLLQRPGVVGTAIGVDDEGNVVIKIFTEAEVSKAALPMTLQGVRVVQEVTGRFVAMKGKGGGGGGGGGGGVDHKAKQTAPIQLGTSGGWGGDLANGFCCGGTLGSLIQIGAKKYVLSNYHVFESDIVPGGNGIVATTGDAVIQPGLIDVGCNAANAQTVATLVVSHALPGSNVDAAIAEIVPGMVDESGAILEVGTLSAQTVGAFIGQKVKKSGRTTGLTRSSVTGLNATVSVQYEDECAGSPAFTKTFTGQIIIKNRGSKFLAGGDSGSLMVEDVSNNPRAVGLLFAGSSTSAVANPIGEVLSFFNASMVGN